MQFHIRHVIMICTTCIVLLELLDQNRPKFHLARLDLTRLDTFDFVERVKPCCSNMADNEQAIVLACTSLVVFMLLRIQILFVPSNEINVYSHKLVNNLHSRTLYKLHNILRCMSNESSSSYRVVLFDTVRHRQNAWARHVERIESCRGILG